MNGFEVTITLSEEQYERLAARAASYGMYPYQLAAQLVIEGLERRPAPGSTDG